MKWFAIFLAGLLALASPAYAVINSPAAQTIAAGNGATIAFNYSFIIPYQSDGVTPAVTVDLQDNLGVITTLSPSLYTITGVGNSAGGTVVYPLSGAPLASGNYLIITRSLDYTQPTAVSNTSFLPHTVEQIADKLDMQIQQLSLKIGSGSSVSINPLILSSGAGTWQLSVDGSGNLNMTRTAGSGVVNIGNGTPVLVPWLPTSTSYANDTLAASGGIAIGQLYRNGSVTQVRVN